MFVDTDVETFQIDARKIAAAITERTKVVMPVHLGGAVADLDTILAAAAPRRLPVVEDACQAHLAEWKGRKVGTYGRAGCFSFQASKNLNCAEGGAILTNDAELLETCYRFHNNSRGRATAGSTDFSYRGVGANLRLTEFQAAMLLAQMTRLEQQARTRDSQRRVSDHASLDDPGHRAGAHVPRLHAQCVPPLHVPLRQRGVWWRDAHAVSQGAAVPKACPPRVATLR